MEFTDMVMQASLELADGIGMLRGCKTRLDKTFPWNMVKNGIKNVIFLHIFRSFLEEKDQNIHLNDKFPLNIANVSLRE